MKKNLIASVMLAFAAVFALADNLGTTTKVGSLSRSTDYVYTADQADALFGARVPTNRTVNGHALTGNVTVGEGDITVTPGYGSTTSLGSWIDSVDTYLGQIVPKSGTSLLGIMDGKLVAGSNSTTQSDLNINGTNVIAAIPAANTAISSAADTASSASSTAGTAVQSVKISGSNTELKSGTTATIPLASTSAAGAVKLSSATNSTSESLAATPKAVKTALESANAHADAAAAAVAYTHPTYTARTGKPTANASPGFGGTFAVSQITSDSTGHVTGVTDRTITIPSAAATTTAAGLMSATDKTNLDALSSGAVTKSAVSAALTAQGIASTDTMDDMDTLAAKVAAIIAVLEAID